MKYLDYINTNYPIRRSKEQKSRFKSYVLDELKENGLEARIETSSDGKNDNIVIGDPNSAEVVFGAHYDTPGRALFPNLLIPKNRLAFYGYQFVPIILILAVSVSLGYYVGLELLDSMPAFLLIYFILYYGMFLLVMRNGDNPYNYNDNTSGVATVLEIAAGLDESARKKAAFILFDNEEKGKKGSMAYFKDHSEVMKNKLVVNFDCVGNGENFVFIAQKNAEGSAMLDALKSSFSNSGSEETNDGTSRKEYKKDEHASFENEASFMNEPSLNDEASFENETRFKTEASFENEASFKAETSFNNEASFKAEFCDRTQARANSDHKSFPMGVGCVATKRTKGGLLYAPYIHTTRDTVANNSNIAYLTKNCIDFIAKI